MELTNTNVRYLLTIYHLSQARLEVSSKDIAQTLDVSRASVTSMMSILTDKRLVTKERYGKVHLTDDGCRWARVLASQTDKLAETLQNRMELSYEEAWKPATVLSPSMFQTDRERKFSNHEVVSESEGPLLCRRRGRRPGGSQGCQVPQDP